MPNNTDLNQTSAPKNEERIIDTILSKTSDTDLKSILGPSPLSKFNKKTVSSKLRFNPGWNLVKTGLLLGFFVFTYFYIQLAVTKPFLTKFVGENYLTKLTDAQQTLLDTQTAINQKNYLVAKLALDKFVYLADAYNYQQSQLSSKYDTTVAKDKVRAESKDTASQISETLAVVKDKLNEPLYSAVNKTAELDQLYKTALTTRTQEDKRNLLTEIAKTSEDSKQELRQEMQNLDTVTVLAHSAELPAKLAKVDVKNLSDQDINDLLKISNKITKNDFSIVNKIKDDRIAWSKIINDIVRVTSNVDALFGHGALGNLEEISYNSFNFEAETGKITVIGETKRDDAKNFTLLANLIDAFEQSTAFKDVEGRTFTKNKGGAEDVTATTAPLRLTFARQTEEDGRDKKEGLEEQEKKL